MGDNGSKQDKEKNKQQQIKEAETRGTKEAREGNQRMSDTPQNDKRKQQIRHVRA